MTDLYVSTKGNDINDGSEGAKVKTLFRARDIAREVKDAVTVHIEEGVYRFDKTLALDERDSDTLFIGEGNVEFSGGVSLDNSKIKDYKDKIKMIDLSFLGVELHELGNRGFRRAMIPSPNELFIDGKAQSIARYPKKGLIYYKEDDIVEPGSYVTHLDFSCKCARLKLDGEKFDLWSGAKHAYLAGYPRHAWADECVKIASFNKEDRTVTTSQPSCFSYGFTHHSGYYIVNLLEELTDPGEYYIDIDTKILYFIPKDDVDLKKSDIAVSLLGEVMIALEGAEHVTFKNITFEYSRATAVYIERGDGCRIDGCTFRCLGQIAVQVGKGASPLEHGLNSYHGAHAPNAKPYYPVSREIGSWHEYLYEFAAWDSEGGKNHRIENCKIYDTASGGIILSGGNRKTLTPANNSVYNCEFYNVNRLDKMYKSAVNMMGVGNSVSHCYIHDLTAMAIYVHGNDHIIEDNEITNVCTEASDSGAIYMGRDMSEVGNVFRRNYIHDIKNTVETGLGVAAIYFDDWDIFNAVYDNFFVRIEGGGFCIIHHTCGGLLSFHNNFIVDCTPGVMPDNKSNSYVRMHREPLIITRIRTEDENDIRGVDITSKVYKEKYPYLYDVYENDTTPEWMYYNNTLTYHKYDMFTDAKNGDFTQADWFDKTGRDEFDNRRRTDVVMGYNKELVLPHRVDFKSIGLIKEK